jgi:hypothetical protein
VISVAYTTFVLELYRHFCPQVKEIMRSLGKYVKEKKLEVNVE